jgi:tRNA nucleotidyltransferase/poly(A) polymerase
VIAMDKPLAAALEAVKKLETMGHRAAVVGGAVRDLLLCHDIRDADITTSASLASVIEIWPESKLVGRPPDVSAILTHGKSRIDLSSYHGKSLEEDLGRRDLTINAMAMSSDGSIIDPWGGTRDLASGILRFTGNPRKRLEEDPLRCVRLARFASSLPWFEIDPASAIECKQSAPQVRNVHLQRTGREILLSLEGNPALFVGSLESLGLLEAVIPFWDGLPEPEKIITIRRTRIASEMSSDKGIRAFALLASAGDKTREICTSWCWPSRFVKDTENLAKYRNITFGQLDSHIFTVLFREMGPGWIDRLFLAGLIDSISMDDRMDMTMQWSDNRRKTAIWSARLKKNFDIVSGDDIIMVAGKGPGPLIGKILSSIRCHIAEGAVRNKKEALLLAKKYSEE